MGNLSKDKNRKNVKHTYSNKYNNTKRENDTQAKQFQTKYLQTLIQKLNLIPRILSHMNDASTVNAHHEA